MPENCGIEHAVVLAGGLGTRLAPVTTAVPKPLVPVRGRPFLAYQLEALRRHCVTHVLLLTGHLGDKIEAAFGDGKDLGLTITYSREPKPLGTGGALVEAGPLLPPDFFLLNGDTFMDFDYQAAAALYLKSRRDGPFGLMVVGDAHGLDDPGNVKLDASGTRVESYRKGAGGEHDHVDAGFLILNSAVKALIPDERPAGLELHVFPQLASQGRLVAFMAPVKFYDIGTPERLAVFERFIA